MQLSHVSLAVMCQFCNAQALSCSPVAYGSAYAYLFKTDMLVPKHCCVLQKTVRQLYNSAIIIVLINRGSDHTYFKRQFIDMFSKKGYRDSKSESTIRRSMVQYYGEDYLPMGKNQKPDFTGGLQETLGLVNCMSHLDVYVKFLIYYIQPCIYVI